MALFGTLGVPQGAHRGPEGPRNGTRDAFWTPRHPQRPQKGTSWPQKSTPKQPNKGQRRGRKNASPSLPLFGGHGAPKLSPFGPKRVPLEPHNNDFEGVLGPTWVQDGPRWPPQTSSSEPRVLMTTFWPISCPKTCRVRSHVSPQRLNFGTMWPRVGPTLDANNVFGCQVRCWDSPDRSTNQSISRSIDQSNQWSQSIN